MSQWDVYWPYSASPPLHHNERIWKQLVFCSPSQALYDALYFIVIFGLVLLVSSLQLWALTLMMSRLVSIHQVISQEMKEAEDTPVSACNLNHAAINRCCQCLKGQSNIKSDPPLTVNPSFNTFGWVGGWGGLSYAKANLQRFSGVRLLATKWRTTNLISNQPMCCRGDNLPRSLWRCSLFTIHTRAVAGRYGSLCHHQETQQFQVCFCQTTEPPHISHIDQVAPNRNYQFWVKYPFNIQIDFRVFQGLTTFKLNWFEWI